ncbi:MAG: DUF2089 domain-containing protein [Armatimonadota bacterium]|nr:DUF2089 domain-containing protein [Armatimonadota bacterium]
MKMSGKAGSALPVECPSCGGRLAVGRLSCPACGTGVDGSFQLPPLARISRRDQEFVVAFVKASGSLKEMASLLGVSYPTVRGRLDEIIGNLTRAEEEVHHD